MIELVRDRCCPRKTRRPALALGSGPTIFQGPGGENQRLLTYRVLSLVLNRGSVLVRAPHGRVQLAAAPVVVEPQTALVSSMGAGDRGRRWGSHWGC